MWLPVSNTTLLFVFPLRRRCHSNRVLQLGAEVTTYWNSRLVVRDFLITRVLTACFSPTSRLFLPSLPACYVMTAAPPTYTHPPPLLSLVMITWSRAPFLCWIHKRVTGGKLLRETHMPLGDWSRELQSATEKIRNCWELCERQSWKLLFAYMS